MFLVDAVVQLLELGGPTTTFCPERTMLAIGLAAPVRALGVALAIGPFALEEQFGPIARWFGTLVIILFFVENKSFPLGLILSEVGDIGINVFIVQIRQRLSAAVTAIGQELFQFNAVSL